MKCVELKQVFKYKDSDKWLSEEVYGQLLMASITFLPYQKQFINITIFIINICLTSLTRAKPKEKMEFPA